MTTNRTDLLVDDASDVRAVLRVALKSEGYRVREAADGRENVGRIMARVSHARNESGKPVACEESSGLL